MTTPLLLSLLQIAFDNFQIVFRVENNALVVQFRPRLPAIRLKIINSHRKEITMLSLSSIQKCVVSITPVDKKGHPASIDGVPVWTVSADGIVSLFPAPDGLSCEIVAETPGSCQVNVSADADLGSGVKTITGTLDVTVTASEAAGFTINTGAIEDQ